MKNVLVALVCTVGAVACGGEKRPAESPPGTSITTETTTTSAAEERRTPSTMTTSTPSTPPSTMDTTPLPQTSTTPTPAPADTTRQTSPDVTGTAPATSNPGSADRTKDATNTGINDRDRQGALTPMDQGGGKDRDITAAIRRAVVSDNSLSLGARNVKIITVAGKVTLRGPVKSEAEKATIEAKAKAAAGVTEVDNQLEVKK
jgi:hyperosmotically inducible periplasmic protein